MPTRCRPTWVDPGLITEIFAGLPDKEGKPTVGDVQKADLGTNRWKSVAAAYEFDGSTCPSVPSSSVREPEFRSFDDSVHPGDGYVGLGAEGIEFAVAKSAATQIRWWAHDTLLLDAINRRYSLDGIPVGHAPANLRDILVRDGVRRLAVVAHGDGGHLNLGELVLCGLYTDIEHDLDRGIDLNAGCRVDVRCKRAPDIAAVVLCQAVRAAEVIIVSCKAGMLVEPAFRTTTNVVVGFADGFASSIVAPMGNAQVSTAVTEGLRALLEAAALDEVRDYLDDVSGRDTAQFRLLGTRAGLGERAPAATASDRVTVHRLPAPGRIAIRRGPQVRVAPGSTAVFGGRHLVVPTEVTPSDFTIAEHWRPNRIMLDEQRAQLDRIRLTRMQMASSLAADGSPQAHGAREALERVGVACEVTTWSWLQNLRAGTDHGLGTEPRSTGPLGRLLDDWAAAVAEAYVLLDSVDPFRLTASGLWADDEESTAESCELCGATLHVSTLTDVLSTIGFRRYDCPHCAARRAEPIGPGAGRIHIGIDRDQAGYLELVVDPGARQRNSIHVVWRVDFKGAQRPAASMHVARETTVAVPITIPTAATDQLHTARVVVISGAQIWMWRTRLKVR